MLMGTEAYVSRRQIDEPQLHPLSAIPAVEAQGAGCVDGLPARVSERDPKFLSGGTKCDGIDDRTIAGAQSRPYMGLAHLVGIHQGMRRKCNDRLGIACAERTRAGDRRHAVV